jgi:hypothetical protein
MRYRYEIRATIVRDGQEIPEVRSVVLTAGSDQAVAFGFNVVPGAGLAAR